MPLVRSSIMNIIPFMCPYNLDGEKEQGISIMNAKR